jgi:hypothetical protein
MPQRISLEVLPVARGSCKPDSAVFSGPRKGQMTIL